MPTPTYRAGSGVITQNTLTAETTPATPTGVKPGDVVFCWADVFQKTAGAVPTLTAPAGWNLVNEYVDETVESRRLSLWWKVWPEGGSMGTWKTSSIPVNSTNFWSIAIETGTINKTAPVAVSSGIVAGATGTTQTVPSVTAVSNESRAILFVASPTGFPKEISPVEGWGELPGSKASMQIWTGPALSNGQSIPATTYKKGGTTAKGAAITIILAPPGSFVNLPLLTQSQNATLNKLVERFVPTLVQTQVAKLGVGYFTSLPTIIQSTVQSVTGQVSRKGELIQLTVISMTKQVVRAPFPTMTVTQNVSLTKQIVKAPFPTITQTQVTPRVIASTPRVLPTIQQTPEVAMGNQVERVQTAQAHQVISRAPSQLTRTLTIAQSTGVHVARALTHSFPLLSQPQFIRPVGKSTPRELRILVEAKALSLTAIIRQARSGRPGHFRSRRFFHFLR